MTTENSGKQFGGNVWWYVPACVIDGEFARKCVVDGGMSKDMLLEPTRREEVARAARSVAGRRKKLDKSIAEKVTDNIQTLAYGILDYDQSGEVGEYEQQTTVRMDKASGSVIAEGAKAEKVMAAVDAFTGKITDKDIRTFILNVVKSCHGVSKRPTGGIYFIPAKYVERIEAARNILKAMGTGAKIYKEEVVNNEEARQNVWEACENSIAQQLEQTLDACERIEKRASAVRSKQAKLNELNELMGVYTDLLGEEAKYESIKDKIEAAAKVVQEKMAKVQLGTAAVLSKVA